MFDRLIAIDWSGALTDNDRVDIRVAQWARGKAARLVEPPANHPAARNWTRAEVLQFLTQELQEGKPRTAVAMDFPFGYPWGSDEHVFQVHGWEAMVRSIRGRHERAGSARQTAERLNLEERFDGHGPFRFNHNRTDYRFYVDNGVSYYRLTELVAPQASSVWYLGAGPGVGHQTITGLSLLAELVCAREEDRVTFTIWPHEGADGRECHTETHVLLEGYPAILPEPAEPCPCQNEHARDAWKMLSWMRIRNAEGGLEGTLQLPQDLPETLAPNGENRVSFEGWILGLR